MAGAGMIACPGCGARYPFKPQLAGKKVRCKCGVTFEASPPKALPAVDAEEKSVLSLREDEPRVAAAPTPMTATATAAASSPASPGGIDVDQIMARYPLPRRVKAVAEDDKPRSRGMLVGVIAIALVLIGGAVFAVVMLKGNSLSDANLKGDDAKIVGMIRDDGATEIRKWLSSSPRHMVLHQTNGQVLHLADRLYNLGAVEVLAFGETITASLAVELPTDPAKRKALLEFEQEHNSRRTAIQDVGQKYLLLHMM